MMADIEQKALALVNEVLRDRELPLKVQMCRLSQAQDEALCRALEQHENTKQEHAARLIAMHSLMAKTEAEHEAFRQEVSDVASVCAQHFCENSWTVGDRQDHVDMLHRFIILKPKPDPLVAALEGVTFDHYPPNDAKTIRAALNAAGFEIREKNDE